jgi:hypothetical protein
MNTRAPAMNMAAPLHYRSRGSGKARAELERIEG